LLANRIAVCTKIRASERRAIAGYSIYRPCQRKTLFLRNALSWPLGTVDSAAQWGARQCFRAHTAARHFNVWTRVAKKPHVRTHTQRVIAKEKWKFLSLNHRDVFLCFGVRVPNYIFGKRSSPCKETVRTKSQTISLTIVACYVDQNRLLGHLE
jgi:hypothetical protein